MSPSAKTPLAILFLLLIGALVALAPASPAPAQALDETCWTGSWEQYPRMGTMWLSQNGTTVSGNYDWDYGRLRGTVDGDRLRGEWAEWPTYAPPTDAGTFEFTARPGCNEFYGHYTYGSDPEWNTWTGQRIEAPGRVAMQVIEPTVTYRGLEYQPGDTFFPEACDATQRSTGSEPCEDTLMLESQVARYEAARALSACVYHKIKKVLAIVEQANLNEDEEALVLAIALAKGYEKCVFDTRAPAEMGLELSQGVARITGLTTGHTISVDVQLATATAARPGSFIAGYHPQTNEAVFVAYSAPLSVTPVDGPPLVLPPFHEVTLTPGGFGPMEELPLLYMPVVVNR